MTVKEALAVLEVAATATPEEIKRAYKELVTVWHPDRFQKNPELHRRAHDKLKQINAAHDEILKFAASHAPGPPAAPKTQPTPAAKPEPVPPQSTNPESSQTVTSIVIPNSHKRDFDGTVAHLNQFGRWGMDNRKRFIVANWSWHTVVRIYVKRETIEVVASPRAETMLAFGVPSFFIAHGLAGNVGLLALGPESVYLFEFAPSFLISCGLIALGVASGCGIGWLFWWMFLLSNTCGRMQKILVAPTPPKPLYK